MSRNLLACCHGKLGFKFYVVLFLLFMSITSIAQVNTGAIPYIYSWHSYRVVVGSTNDTREWEITKAPYTDTISLDDAMAWVTILPLDGDSADISLCFTDSVFADGDTWELLYREISFTSGACTAARKFTITPVDNDFYFTLAANQTICKDLEGTILSWDTIAADPYFYNTSFTYRVTLHKASSFKLTGWSFDAQITLDPAATHTFTSYTTTVDPVSEGTTVITDGIPYGSANDGIFHVAMEDTLTTATRDSVAVDITVTLNGLVHDSVYATLELLNGEATSGVASVTLTYDNLHQPTDPGDRQQLFVLNALPATKNIDIAPLESAWSAANPAQYSTHSYTVELGDMTANYSNAGSGWSLDTLGGGAVSVSDYVIGFSPSATDDTVTFTFNMVPGSYVIKYTEVGTNGCSTIREFPITIEQPFDVDIVDAASVCPDISGYVSFRDSVSLTTVEYTIQLVDTLYAADWEFDFDIAIPLGTPGNLFLNTGDITLIDANGNAAYTEGADAYHGKVEVAYNSTTPTKSFILRVVYHSKYDEQYQIQASLTNITGSFGERDQNTEAGAASVDDDVVGLDVSPANDGNDQNNTKHYINSIPTPLVLAGVE